MEEEEGLDLDAEARSHVVRAMPGAPRDTISKAAQLVSELVLSEAQFFG